MQIDTQGDTILLCYIQILVLMLVFFLEILSESY